MISTRVPAGSAPVSRRIAFLLVCAVAGALAAPLDAVATPATAAAAVLVAMLGLRVWTWSGLATATRDAGRPLFWIVVGLAVGVVLLSVIRLAIEPKLPEMGSRIAAAGALPMWRRIIIIYVAAVTEELLFRLLLLSAIAGLLSRVRRRTRTVPQPVDVWVAITVSALAFAAVHLPAWDRRVAMSIALMASVLALNAAAGLVMGYVFTKHGISSAMWVHAGGDTAIQVLGPLTG